MKDTYKKIFPSRAIGEENKDVINKAKEILKDPKLAISSKRIWSIIIFLFICFSISCQMF
jgi:hypothetical protein